MGGWWRWLLGVCDCNRSGEVLPEALSFRADPTDVINLLSHSLRERTVLRAWFLDLAVFQAQEPSPDELPFGQIVTFQWFITGIWRVQSSHDPSIGCPRRSRKDDEARERVETQPILNENFPKSVRGCTCGWARMQGSYIVGHRTVHMDDQQVDRISRDS